MKTFLEDAKEVIPFPFFLAWLGGVVLPLIMPFNPLVDMVPVVIAILIVLVMKKSQDLTVQYRKFINISLVGFTIPVFLKLTIVIFQPTWMIGPDSPLVSVNEAIILNPRGITFVLLSMITGLMLLMVGLTFIKNATSILEEASTSESH